MQKENDAFYSKNKGKETDNYGNEHNRSKNKGRKTIGKQEDAGNSNKITAFNTEKSEEDKMNIPINLIKYVLFGIILIVMTFKVFELTKRIVKKWKNKNEDDLDLKDIDMFETL